jgi:hypothetical protein
MDDNNSHIQDLEKLKKEIEEKLTPSQRLLLINMLNEELEGMTDAIEEMASALKITQEINSLQH